MYFCYALTSDLLKRTGGVLRQNRLFDSTLKFKLEQKNPFLTENSLISSPFEDSRTVSSFCILGLLQPSPKIVTLAQMDNYYTLLVMGLLADVAYFSQGEEICASPQYLELGKTGTIDCTFQERFFAVVWYNSTNSTMDNLLLHYQSSLKLGPGYQFGEFDVFPNGSLIINNVSLQNDHVFRVVYMPSDEDAPYPIDVRIIVKIPANPVIDECNQRRTCIIETKCDGNLTCRVEGIRPAVRLKWRVFSDIDSEVISFSNEQLIIEDKGETYDVTFKATYHIINASLKRMTLECVDSEGTINLGAQIELLISRRETRTRTTVTPSVSAANRFVREFLLALSIIGSIILVAPVSYLCFKSHRLQEKLNKVCTLVNNHLKDDPHQMRCKNLDNEVNGTQTRG